jgi:hypothetical protein
VAHHTDEREDTEEEIHLPAPSFAPSIIGLGITFVCFGLLWSLPLLAVGGLILLAGIAMWLLEDARTFSHASDHGGGH